MSNYFFQGERSLSMQDYYSEYSLLHSSFPPFSYVAPNFPNNFLQGQQPPPPPPPPPLTPPMHSALSLPPPPPQPQWSNRNANSAFDEHAERQSLSQHHNHHHHLPRVSSSSMTAAVAANNNIHLASQTLHDYAAFNSSAAAYAHHNGGAQAYRENRSRKSVHINKHKRRKGMSSPLFVDNDRQTERNLSSACADDLYVDMGVRVNDVRHFVDNFNYHAMRQQSNFPYQFTRSVFNDKKRVSENDDDREADDDDSGENRSIVIEDSSDDDDDDNDDDCVNSETTKLDEEITVVKAAAKEKPDAVDLKRNSRNWRCRSLFNGCVRDFDLPPNCERPQAEEGRDFPVDEGGILKQRECSTNGVGDLLTTKQMPEQHGYILPNGRTWVRKRPAESTAFLALPSRESNIPRTASDGSLKPPAVVGNTNSPTAMFRNKSLRIVNGKRMYDGTKECFKFVNDGKCLAGIFCAFTHNGSTEHQSTKACLRQLRGLCRDGERCRNGDHSLLLTHQYPVCDYYLRMTCSNRDCCYLHVKHSFGSDPCVDFNRGQCFRGIMCDRQHHYYYSAIKARCMSNTVNVAAAAGVSTTQRAISAEMSSQKSLTKRRSVDSTNIDAGKADSTPSGDAHGNDSVVFVDSVCVDASASNDDHAERASSAASSPPLLWFE